MSYVKRDLLVHFDEASGQYSFFAVDAADAVPLRAAAGGKLAADASFFGESGSAQAEQAIGRLLLTLLDRAYAAAPSASPDTQRASAQATIAAGAAEFAQFVELQSRAMKEYSADLLAKAEGLLKAAASLGHEDAAETLKDWPTVKIVSQKLIARGPQ
ncbi:MAG TPA: hypothetical protein PLX20_09910 [Rhodocyclaceae bacterium]|nr:hypothetical protein [Rhodocyclaceae bacterium]HMZ82801.1 hypothetical protein [Rhodocyclaceae bacterium]HNA02464.1 hypothetical protein [Rhodocyclaceae bacterium]HNB79853.1 hypothetical protein [Rhodocyclaceae bacterium]HNC60923.1 hypothetical protein [Rhodocyclaceae bacterium]